MGESAVKSHSKGTKHMQLLQALKERHRSNTNITEYFGRSSSSTTGISSDRVARVCQYFVQHGTPRPELLGGARNVEENEVKRDAIKQHIMQFKCRASHYGRKDSPGRRYLPCDLSVAKMHSLFEEQNHLQASYALYYSVFKTAFNLGFGHPATDVCWTCESLKSRVKQQGISETQQREEAASFILHRRQARSFYDALNLVPPNTLKATILRRMTLTEAELKSTKEDYSY
ncbi:uncharacterized protein LOC135477562 isoform X2 [Liolophura sinensis]|uniref:uncharacterized protein LOC135477562 isoform X2 n=1 Tax=Liolophura sinensis TaxID=3198878 RepID=UPI0031585631